MKKWTWLLVVVLLTMSLACLGSGGKETVVPTEEAVSSGETVKATAVPADEKQPEPTAKAAVATKPTTKEESTAGGEVLADLQLSAWDALDSYRGTMTLRYEGVDGNTGEMTMLQEATKDPLAMRYLITVQGQMPGQEILDTSDESMEIEVIQIGDQQWMRFGEMWMQTSGENSASMEDFTQFIDTEDLDQVLKDKNMKYIGKENVNGVQTRHYQGAYNALLGGFFAAGQDIKSGTIEMWIADGAGLPNFVIKMEVEAEGILEIDEETGTQVEGKMVITQEVQEINQPITITAPEDAGGAMPEDVPEYPNSEGLSAFGGMITFNTTDAVEDVTTFYEGAMAEAGWTAQEESFLGPTWEKDGRTLSLLVNVDENTGMTSVVIMINENE
ncbi:MAG: hypothetical protein JXA33_04405 [Anaerolineae bacterium]|nr:hypothetical protein [Anaerolineae bacterium]